ncbi:SusC/RagA family TonB-linked outer membrane protein [Flavobacterium sp. LMO8]|uniref:SusC/RagA family TonB-linked outer membrane protein n=1 Tax=Flavobacterium sp. LMO8 TaxID=2654244 RepID=UPI0012912ADD|nr:SusC/RagA family TonB-linked outer membrane protein [Flavobacterium sp. LMO8]MQP24424.1 SusC/RagA family TonB-linked outer membrane protein [Flavobacterium sp. LMO8]
MNLKIKLTLVVTLLFNMALFAQDSFVVKGVVSSKSDELVLPGANVLVQGTKNGVTTDFDGNYTIKVKKGDILQFSYIGYVPQLIIVGDQKEINISLVENVSKLDDIVVIGYGTIKKSHLTGSISKVINEDLDQVAVSRVDDALVGQVSGVNVQATNGEAGSAPTIQIRGVGSLNGATSPLIVVDGLVVDDDYLGSLDMTTIESFEVLKDAASSAIYGSRGSNGIIMITTKQGDEGKTVFKYNTYTGRKEARQSDAYRFSVAETAARELAATGTNSAKTQYMQRIGVDNDWQNIIFNGGNIVSHALSARGGNKTTKFSTSLNYLHDEGVLLTDDFKKYGLNVKVDTKVSEKFSFGANLSPSYTKQRRFDGSTHDILRQPSWLPLYLDENTIQFVNRLSYGGAYANAQIGDYAQQRMFDDYDLVTGMPVASGGTDISDTSNTNPGAKVLERYRTQNKLKIYGTVYGEYKFNNRLKFRTSFGGDFQNTDARRWQGVLASRNGAAAAQLDLSTFNRIHLVTDNYFTFDFNKGNHELNLVLGTSAETWNSRYNESTGTGYTSDLIQTMSAATLFSGITSEEYDEKFFSLFFRTNYAYKDRYLASFSIRRDASSVFGPNNKYGNFPAASLGWIISREDFLKESGLISYLKARASYGFSGNKDVRISSNQINSYPYLSLLEPSTYVVNGNIVTGYNPINAANSDLKWERLREVNIGLDFGLLKNKITGSVDVYQRNSDQLLLNNPVSYTTGFSDALVNLGEVQNSGVEFELRTRNISNENFKWSSTLIASHNKNELLNFGDSDGQIQNVDDKRASEWINLVGNPISSFYGWVVDSDIPLEYISNPYFPVNAEAQDVYVKDLNGDGIIDDDDKTILGNPYPDLVWSITNEFKYKNFDLSFMFQGSHGAETRNMGDQYLFNHFSSAQDYISSTPNQGFIKQKIFTNDIIQDASYIALRNVNFGYNFSKDLMAKLGFLGEARLYVAAQNLMYFTANGYTGFNPESVDTTSPTTYGYQRAGAPIFSTVSLGVNLEF